MRLEHLWLVAIIACGGVACGTNNALCGPTTCNGCCDADQACRPGLFPTECGSGGLACQLCSSGMCSPNGVCATLVTTSGGGGGTTGGGGGSTGGGGGTTGGGGGLDDAGAGGGGGALDDAGAGGGGGTGGGGVGGGGGGSSSCSNSTMCSAPRPVCNTALNVCVVCTSSEGCLTPQRCDTSAGAGVCVDCLQNADCGASAQCLNATCRPFGAFGWVKRAGGASADLFGGLAINGDGGVVLTGTFGTTAGASATFGPGESGQRVLVSDGGSDAFVAGLSASTGNTLFARRAGGLLNDKGLAAAGDYVAGTYAGTALFGQGDPNQTSLTASGATSATDVFVARHAPTGALGFARSHGSTSADTAESLSVAPNGNLVLAGQHGTAITFGSSTLAGGGGFVALLDANGFATWGSAVGTATGLSVSASADNGFILAGTYNGTLTLGTGTPSQASVTSMMNSNDFFLARYDASGTLLWLRSGGSLGADKLAAVESGPNGGACFGGFVSGTVTMGSVTVPAPAGVTAQLIFMGCIDGTGTFSWGRSTGGNGGTALAQASAVAFLSTGEIAFAGPSTWGPVVFGSGELTQTTIAEASFVAVYGPTGTLRWAKGIGNAPAIGNFVRVLGLRRLDQDTLVLAGELNGNSSIGATTLNGAGGVDVFAAALQY